MQIKGFVLPLEESVVSKAEMWNMVEEAGFTFGTGVAFVKSLET